ncbi:MAG: imidazole glycerol phosphate synthase subunit HisH [Pirellulaceae bacterium]
MPRKLDIAIVDYQMGNLRSVQKAFEQVGASATVTSDPEEIALAQRVVLPGVGAFGDAIRELSDRDLTQPIIEAVAAGKPFLGICLGLQLLFDVGTEGTEHQGLGILPGRVERFAPHPGLKVPHMGWNQVQQEQPDCPLFASIPASAYFYFVHSYYVVPADTDQMWLSCEYSTRFCAAVWRDNLFATQFHPEKSQADGLKLLQNFAAL